MKIKYPFFTFFFITSLITLFFVMYSRPGLSTVPSEPVIVAELFTSQSCSSCPPADRVLSQLSKNENVIALSCNVTYWNHLHWKDTLSLPFCTERQKHYANQIHSRVYTPQLIINGRYDVVGSHTGKINKLLSQTTADNVQLAQLKKNGENQIDIYIPKLDGNNMYTLYLLGYQKHHVQDVPSGENRGKTLSYTNAIREVYHQEIINAEGTNKTYTISLDGEKTEGAIALIQNTHNGRILSAGKLEL